MSAGGSTSTFRILIQARRRLVREGLALALGEQDGIDVAGVASDAEQLQELIDLTSPDVVVTDLRLGVGSGPPRVIGINDQWSLASVVHAIRGEQSDAPVRQRGEPAGARLTARELDVVEQLSLGRTSAEAALSLGISTKTLSNHRQRIYEKLDVQSRPQAVARALEQGWIPRRSSLGQPRS